MNINPPDRNERHNAECKRIDDELEREDQDEQESIYSDAMCDAKADREAEL